VIFGSRVLNKKCNPRRVILFAPVWMIWATDLPQFKLSGASKLSQFGIDLSNKLAHVFVLS